MRNSYITLLILFLSSTFSSLAMAENELTVSVDKAWGLLLGDEVNIRVDLSSQQQGIDKTSLPALNKRYGAWLYLRSIDSDMDKVIFHYQVVNVPTKNTEIDTPTFNVKMADESWGVVPSLPITIGPSLAAAEGISNLVEKADVKPTMVSLTEDKQQLKISSIIAVIALLVLAFWHFGWKTKNRQPFAQAVHDLSRLSFHTVTPDQAARILHQAFNSTTGTTVVYGEIDNLINNHSWLAPLKNDIELFYTQSESHFFARKSEQGPDIDAVRKLAKACRSKEMLA